MVEIKFNGRRFVLTFLGWLLFAYAVILVAASAVPTNGGTVFDFGMIIAFIAALVFAAKDSMLEQIKS